MRIGRSIAAVSGSAAGSLVGLFLMISPWTAHLNRANGSWSLATKTDFWSGLGVLVVSLASWLLYQGSLRREMVEAGVITPEARVEESDAPSEPTSAPAGPISDENLLALVNAMVNDLEGHESEPPQVSQKAPSEDDLVRLATALLAEIKPDEKKPEAPKPPEAEPRAASRENPALVSENDLLKMATSLLEEIQRTRAPEPLRKGSDGGE